MFKRFHAPTEPFIHPKEAACILSSELTAALPTSPVTTIASDVAIEGSLHFQGILHIAGRFQGDTLSSGILHIASSGVVIADLELEEATIYGSVKGNLYIRKKLTLKAGSQIEGNISAPLVEMEEGVILHGHVNIQQIVTPSSSLDEEDEHYQCNH